MTGNWKSIAVGLAIATLLVTAGCNSGTENAAEGNLASIPGNSDSSSKDPLAKPKPAGDPLYPVVEIDTNQGKIKVRLDRKSAQLTVDNFLSYVENKFYDQTIFHQVLKNYVILGGGYTADLVEKPARAAKVRNEARNGKKNTRGTIAMARRADVIDSSTSQFFINVADNPQLDHKEKTPGVVGPPEEYGYCVFGEVIEGMDVVEKISNLPVHDKGELERVPDKSVVVNSIRRIQ